MHEEHYKAPHWRIIDLDFLSNYVMKLVLPFTQSSWRIFGYLFLVGLKSFECFFIVKPQNQYLDQWIPKNLK